MVRVHLTKNDAAIQLAADVLLDHFGEVTARVATVLLERGALSVQGLLRFVNEDAASPDGLSTVPKGADPAEELGQSTSTLTFPHVRNALLTLIRHGVARPRAQPANASPDGQGVQPSIFHDYIVDLEDVFARLRFPHYLEHCLLIYGPMAQELLFPVLKHGWISAESAVTEAQAALQQRRGARRDSAAHQLVATPEQLHEVLKRLAHDRLLSVVEPSPDVTSSAEAGTRKRRLEQDSDKRVYRCNRYAFDFCISRTMFARSMEEAYGIGAAQLVEILLSAYKTPDSSAAEPGQGGSTWSTYQAIEMKMKAAGWMPEGGSAAVHEQIEVLASKHGILQKRAVQVAAPSSSASVGSRAYPTAGGIRPGERQETEFRIDWNAASTIVVDATNSQLIRKQFGQLGLRVYNLLREQRGEDPRNKAAQKMDETAICNACMCSLEEGRRVINEMVRLFVVQMQEVPSKRMGKPIWLFYVDRKRLEPVLLQGVLRAILKLRVRLRMESARVAPLENRWRNSMISRRGPDRPSAVPAALRQGRRTEDALERTFLVLSTAVMIYTCI